MVTNLSLLAESVKDVLGRKVRIGLKKKVKLEVKGDKVENKVLVSAGRPSGKPWAAEASTPPLPPLTAPLPPPDRRLVAMQPWSCFMFGSQVPRTVLA